MKKFDRHIILASKSPRRQFLLKELGFNIEIITKDVDESFPDHLKAQEIPLYLCEKKAAAFDEELKDDSIVITADTIVWINNRVLNKPEDRSDAIRMLEMLSGNRHEVYTGVCFRTKDKMHSFYCRSDVYFKKLTRAGIEFYVDHFKPFDKAGSYGAQESLPAGMNPCSKDEIEFLTKLNKINLIESSISHTPPGSGNIEVERIEGSYFNVMGLPIKEVYEELLRF